jgi:hypothetical protein
LTTNVTAQLNKILLHVKSEEEEKKGAIDISFHDKKDFNQHDGLREDKAKKLKVKCYGVIEVGICKSNYSSRSCDTV